MIVYICSPHSNWMKEAIDQFVERERIIQKKNMDVYLAGLAGGAGKSGGIGDTYIKPIIEKNMEIYLAGGATGNNNKIWKENSKINPEKSMEIFLAGTSAENSRANSEGDFKQKISILESFYYMKDWMIPYIRNHWNFLLDSGAFTFFGHDKKNHSKINWDEYLERYAQFINDNDIKLFFELDIDVIVGLKEVERLREKLHLLTNKQSIPVWRPSRGYEYYKKLIKEFNYIAISASGEYDSKWSRKKGAELVLRQMVLEAKKENCKVHGLGYTSLEKLKIIPFHSVDSTAWLYGNRGGFLYYFNGHTLVKQNKPPGMKLKAREVAVHNFREWIKFQQYAKTNL